MIKASELKEKSLTLQEVEVYLESLIIEAAGKGLKSICTYGPEGIFGNGCLYSGTYPALVQSALTMLKNHGYSACIVVEEKQCVDIYLKVSWS